MTDLGPLIPRNRAIHPAPYDPDYKASVARSPNLPLLSMESTPSEESGPAFGHRGIAFGKRCDDRWSCGRG
jgi:protocatechuate 3,4-dioxygenase beta subunit